MLFNYYLASILSLLWEGLYSNHTLFLDHQIILTRAGQLLFPTEVPWPKYRNSHKAQILFDSRHTTWHPPVEQNFSVCNTKYWQKTRAFAKVAKESFGKTLTLIGRPKVYCLDPGFRTRVSILPRRQAQASSSVGSIVSLCSWPLRSTQKSPNCFPSEHGPWAMCWPTRGQGKIISSWVSYSWWWHPFLLSVYTIREYTTVQYYCTVLISTAQYESSTLQ